MKYEVNRDMCVTSSFSRICLSAAASIAGNMMSPLADIHSVRLAQQICKQESPSYRPCSLPTKTMSDAVEHGRFNICLRCVTLKT